MITSLHHSFKIENINFFWILSFISWANTFKIREFRPKSENFHHHSNFFMNFILRKKYLLPLFTIALKSKISFFLRFHHLFRGLTPLKIENFDQKLNTSTTTQKHFMMFLLRKNNDYLSSSLL